MQADLRVFSWLGLYGLSAITAITIQNTIGTREFHPIKPAHVKAQLQVLAADVAPAAVKTGMLATPETVEVVAKFIVDNKMGPLVVDPVLISTSGCNLAKEGVSQAIVKKLVPICRLVTPNVIEAAALTGYSVENLNDAKLAAKKLVNLGAPAACITGGHFRGEPVDVLCDGGDINFFKGTRQGNGQPLHGTGCFFSATIAGYLALGHDLYDSIKRAKNLMEKAIAGAIHPGKGMKVPWLSRLSNKLEPDQSNI